MTYLEDYYLEKCRLNICQFAKYPLCIYGMGVVGQALYQCFRDKVWCVSDQSLIAGEHAQFGKVMTLGQLIQCEHKLSIAVTPVKGNARLVENLSHQMSHQVLGLSISEPAKAICLREFVPRKENINSNCGYESLSAFYFPDEPWCWQSLINAFPEQANKCQQIIAALEIRNRK